jgi:hypothetical protein
LLWYSHCGSRQSPQLGPTKAREASTLPRSCQSSQSMTTGAQNQRGWLGVYQRTVAPVHEGAVLVPKA